MPGMMAPSMNVFETAKTNISMAKTMMIAKQSGMFTNQEVLQIFNYVELASNALQQGQSTDANFYISLQTLSGLKT